jgi:long-chain acyl-CoA synthetase
VVCSLACHEAGWYFLPLNTSLTAAELGPGLRLSEAAVLVVHADLAPLLAQLDGVDPTVRAAVPTVLAVGDVDGIEPLAAACAPFPTTPPTDRGAGSLFVYTSGTTGRPKGIRRTVPEGDPSVVAHEAAVFGRAFDFRPLDGTHLVSTAMYHGGSHSFYMGALNQGQALVIMGRFDPEEALRLVARHRVTTAYMVPTQFHRLLRLPADVRSAYDLSSLRSVVHAAAPCPRDVKQRMLDWWGPVIWETYGGMEAAATIAKPHRWLEKPGTVGRAVRGMSVTILGDDGERLPPGQVGRIYFGAERTPFEYVGDEQATREAFHGRLFTIGDVGYLDEDGYLFLCDRAKDMIITGGVNVYPQEVEAVLLTHPAVADVAVIGLPDADWGEQVKAVVEPTPDARPGPELAADLIAHCRRSLASYKCPRTVDFRAHLPRTDAGKLYKRQIRDEYVGGAAP